MRPSFPRPGSATCTIEPPATTRRGDQASFLQSLACSETEDALGGATCPWKYTVTGMLVGILFPAFAWLLELGAPANWSAGAVLEMHRANPLHWIIDTAPLVLAAFATPIGIWRRRQRLAQYEHKFLESVLGTVDGVILLFDSSGQIWHANRACERILGVAPDEMCARSLWDFVVEDDAVVVRERCAQDIDEGFPCHIESLCALPGGPRRRLAWSITPVPVSTRRLRLYLATGIDVTERHQLHERLAHQAFHDPLTGLANRELFLAQLRRALQADARDVCVLFVDLDGFKGINDRHGHAAGDQLLKAVARLLLNATRGLDTVARLGGDEFAVLLERAGSIENATTVTRRILAALTAPIRLPDAEVRVGASIGVAFSGGLASADTLLCQADTAMYDAKHGGKNRWVVFDPSLHAGTAQRLCLAGELRLAIDRRQFVLHYQPIVDLATGAIVMVEALVRWQHPERGLLPPDAFVPVAEENGLIVPLGRLVLRDACRQVREWQARSAGSRPPLHLSVNVSSHQLRDESLLPDLQAVLEQECFDPRHLLLEITEGVLLQDRHDVQQRLERLRQMGVRLALDDFGTGYSSLSYLQRLPVDLLKLDREFVRQLGANTRCTELTRGVLSLAAALSLETIVEGIEHARQVDALRPLSCRYGQGFLFARPQPAERMARLLDAPLPLAGLLGPTTAKDAEVA